MALHNMVIREVIYDDVANTIAFKLEGTSVAGLPVPPGVRPEHWMVVPTVIEPLPITVRKGVTKAPEGYYFDPATGKNYRVTWSGTSWSAPVEVPAG